MKRLTLIALGVMMLLSCAAASGELTSGYEELFTYDYIAGVIEEGPYFYIVDRKNDNGWGILDKAGTVLIPPVFSDLEYLDNGYFADSNDSDLNNKALVDLAGNTRTDYVYSDFEVLSDRWVVGVKLSETSSEPYDYTNGFFGSGDRKFIVTQYDVFNMGKGDLVGTLERAQYKDAQAFEAHLLVEGRDGSVQLYDEVFDPVQSAFTDWHEDEFYIVKDTFGQKAIASRITGEQIAKGYDNVDAIDGTGLLAARDADNSLYVLMDRSGNVVSQHQFSYVASAYDGYIKVKQNDLCGLYEIATDNIVVPCLYDDIDKAYGEQGFVVNGYACVKKDKKLGFVDLNGNLTCEIKYAEAVSQNMGCSLKVTDIDGSIAIIAADGVVTRGIAEMDDYSGDGYFVVAKDSSGKWGVIDWHGNIVVPHTSDYDNFSIYGDIMRYENTVYALRR